MPFAKYEVINAGKRPANPRPLNVSPSIVSLPEVNAAIVFSLKKNSGSNL